MTTLATDAKFKIYIKDKDGSTWQELGNGTKEILSGNYVKATSSSDDTGMKLNTNVMFTANDDDEMCIVIHEDSGKTPAPANNLSQNHGILELTVSSMAKKDGGGVGTPVNFKLKHFHLDKVSLNGGWTLKKLSTSGGTASAGTTPLAGENVTTMEASGDPPHSSGQLFGNGDKLQIIVGKNNIGWNVAILEDGWGMGDQGTVYFPDVSDVDGDITDSSLWTNGNTKDVRDDMEHSQPVNLKKDSKAGFTMVGWYKGWMKALPKLVDVFNIVDKVYYYDGATNKYVEIPKNSGSAGDWDGPSTAAPNGKNAEVWNINIDGGAMGIWVKVSKTKDDFETAGGRATSSGLPKAPFVFLTYTY